jgi:5-methylcytosine-specific restriction endonuclease McrA
MKRTLIMLYVLKRVKEKNLKKYKELTCEICHEPIRQEIFHYDHIVPVSRYTKKLTPHKLNGIKNLQITCEACNLKKNNKLIKQAYKT